MDRPRQFIDAVGSLTRPTEPWFWDSQQRFDDAARRLRLALNLRTRKVRGFTVSGGSWHPYVLRQTYLENVPGLSVRLLPGPESMLRRTAELQNAGIHSMSFHALFEHVASSNFIEAVLGYATVGNGECSLLRPVDEARVGLRRGRLSTAGALRSAFGRGTRLRARSSCSSFRWTSTLDSRHGVLRLWAALPLKLTGSGLCRNFGGWGERA